MDFVSIDFETADYARESACSIGLVKYQNGKVTGTYYSLIRPPVLYIRPDFTDIHGLTADDVKDAPVFADIWESSVKPFVGDFTLVAHNASFDMGVLRAALAWYELPVPRLRHFCTLSMSRRIWPEFKYHALTALAKRFKITYNAHNALDDARTCGKLVLMAAEKTGNTSGLEELAAATGIRIRHL